MASVHSRRELLAAGAIAASAASLALADRAGAATSSAAPESDAQILETVIGTELLVEFCYQHVLGTGFLSAAAEAVARQQLAQEQEHVQTLTGQLRALGGSPPQPPASVAAAQRLLSAHRVTNVIAGIRNQRESLKLLVSVEGVAEGAYFAALSKLQGARLLRTALEIMCNEAQHATALGEVLRPGIAYESVPYAFVTGTP
jgi:hypothetical protein